MRTWGLKNKPLHYIAELVFKIFDFFDFTHTNDFIVKFKVNKYESNQTNGYNMNMQLKVIEICSIQKFDLKLGF